MKGREIALLVRTHSGPAHELVPPLEESQRDSVLQSSGRRVGKATLGSPSQSLPTPTGLQHLVVMADATPLGLKRNSRSAPRVARASQPWAGGRNLVGIRDNDRRHAAPTKLAPANEHRQFA